MKPDYAIIVKNKTRLETLIERFNTKAQAKFYIERSGGDFSDYEQEHEVFHQALASLQTQLSKIIKHKLLERAFVPSYIFSEKNLIIVIGQDGLVANTAKYANNLPMIAVNPDVQRYDGVLLPFTTNDFLGGVESVLDNHAQYRTARFAEARLNDGQRLLAFNDLFIGAASHVSARYHISFKAAQEHHSSSGLIVSTKAGSTGWLSSIYNMAQGITKGNKSHGEINRPVPGDNELLFVVREPFQSKRTQTGISSGIIKSNQNLVIESQMPVGGVIFSDGIESDFLKFNSGIKATIGLARETASLVLNTQPV